MSRVHPKTTFFSILKHPRLKIVIFLGIIVGLMFKACSAAHLEASNHSKQIIARKTLLNQTLYFNGHVAPLRESSLASPVNATIEQMKVSYGQKIKKNQEIFVLQSTELQKEYHDALTEYLKAKDDFNISKTKFNGTQDLWDSGLISKNNYLSEKSSLANARMNLFQAEKKLKDMLDKIEDGSKLASTQLDLSNMKQVKEALTAPHHILHVKAPHAGILLYPPNNPSENTNKPLSVGHTIKSGQVMALIGDLSGIRIVIDIPEIDIDKVQVGMPAEVSGIAFREHQLQGHIVGINAQASAHTGSALPIFTAIVEVNPLTEKQQSWLKVGMSATVTLKVNAKEKIMIPIDAISQENGQAVIYVKVQNKIQKRSVKTGEAQEDQVAIESGLKENEIVVYPEAPL